ncbi:hypothetical protein QF001_001695 [Paraburkholderia youngii]
MYSSNERNAAQAPKQDGETVISTQRVSVPSRYFSPTSPPPRPLPQPEFVMWIVKLALKRPYTFIVLAVLRFILGPLAIMRTPTDIFPQHRHTGREHRMNVQRLLGPRHGAANHLELRARTHFGRRQHRAHRVTVAKRRLGRETVLPSGCRHQPGDCGGGFELRLDPASAPARHAAAEHHHLQPLDSAGATTRSLREGPARTVAL